MPFENPFEEIDREWKNFFKSIKPPAPQLHSLQSENSSSLFTVCGHCNFQLRKTFKFCPECGNANESFDEIDLLTSLGKSLREIQREICMLEHITIAEWVNFPINFCPFCGFGLRP